MLFLVLVLAASAAPTAPQDAPNIAAPLRQVEVELAGSSLRRPEELLVLGFDVVHRDPRSGVLELLCDDEELSFLDELGVTYTVVHEDAAGFYAERLAAGAAEAAGPPSLGAWLSPPFGQGSMGGYYTWSEVVSVLDQIAAAHPAIVAPKTSLGTSVEGRDVWALEVSDSPGVADAEPHVRLDAMHHAREPESMQAVLWSLLWLVEEYGSDPRATWIVDNREIWVVPVVNPDGYVWNETTDPGGGGLWRKNRRDNGDGTFGVDLNRNYPFQWGADDVGSSPSTSSPTYRGPAPASEPETAAMVALLAARPFDTALSVHTHGNIWIHPWGYTTGAPANEPQYAEISALATAVNGYTWGPSAEVLYVANGVTTDHDQGVHGTLSWTPEIGSSSDGFWPPTSRIVPLAEENLEGIVRTALAAGAWVRHAGTDVADARGGAGDGDGFPEPGETVELRATVRNSGLDATAGSVEVTLTTASPWAAVGQASHDYGAVGSFADAVNAASPLTLELSPATPAGTRVPYALELAWDGFTETADEELVVGVPAAVVLDDAEVELGWTLGLPGDTATTGIWEHGDPVGTSSGGEQSNPEDDASPAGTLCFATGNGSTSAGGDDVDDGFTTLVSPALALAGAVQPRLSYSRWYADLTTPDDVLEVSISDDDGASWVPLETVTTTENEWTERTFFVADFVALTDEVRLRFVASDDPNNSLVEAAVDELRVEVFDTVPRLGVYGSPAIGTDVAFHVTGAAGASYTVLLSEGTGSFSFPSIQGPLLLDPLTLDYLVGGTVPPGATARDVLAIPGDPGLVGLTFYFQALVVQGVSFSLSNRGELTFE